MCLNLYGCQVVLKKVVLVLELELLSNEFNHLAAILHVYAGVWILWSKKKKFLLLFFKKKMEILLHF